MMIVLKASLLQYNYTSSSLELPVQLYMYE